MKTFFFFLEIAWKIFVKTFFFFFFGDRLENFCEDLFFFFWRALALCVLGPWPWPRAFLSLASRVSVLGKAVLGLGFFLCPWPWPRALCPRLHLCSLHHSLRFIFKNESNLTLPFLDVLVEKSFSLSITSIYLKPTFTSQYLRWNFFSPGKRKTNLILTLTHRALAICFAEKLPSDLNKIKLILQTNGYPEHVSSRFG